MVTFSQAYEAAVARYSAEEWADLNPACRIEAIYEEMRRLDAEAAAVMVDAHTTHGRKQQLQSELRRADYPSRYRNGAWENTLTVESLNALRSLGNVQASRRRRQSAGGC